MRKLLLAIQTWPGDVIATTKLTELVCDLEPQFRQDVDFALFHRRDVSKDDCKRWLEVASEKFTTRLFRCNRHGTGWPHGPGDLWQDCMLQVGDMVREGKADWDGVLTFEADCVVLRVDWITALQKEWNSAREEGYQVLGHVHGEGESKHINGNAIFSATMIRDHPETCRSATSWDMEHRGLFLEIGKDTNLITQFYADRNHYSPKQLACVRKNGEIPALLHGLKDARNIDSARELLLVNSNDGI